MNRNFGFPDDPDEDSDTYAVGVPWGAIIALTIIVALIAICVVALAWIASAAQAHDWYTGQHNEKNYTCCGGTDCAPLADGDVIERPDGYWIKSKAVLVPFSRAKDAPVEDGHYHACFYGTPEYREPPEPHNMPVCFFTPPRGY